MREKATSVVRWSTVSTSTSSSDVDFDLRNFAEVEHERNRRAKPPRAGKGLAPSHRLGRISRALTIHDDHTDTKAKLDQLLSTAEANAF